MTASPRASRMPTVMEVSPPKLRLKRTYFQRGSRAQSSRATSGVRSVLALSMTRTS
jgi:hypothetical protein